MGPVPAFSPPDPGRPMTASELFQAGQLQAAIDAQIQKVKAHPADQAARLFLFELILFTGDLDRARKQLDVLRYDNPQATAAVESYRHALTAELARRDVLAGKGRPKFLGQVPEHAELRLQAIQAYAAGDAAGGDVLLDRANSEAPDVRGTLNDQPVAGLRDADDLFGPILEVFGGENYVWVSLELVETVTANPVANPRDVILRPAQLVIRDGPSGDVLLPGLYPASCDQPDESITMGRVTDWLGGDGRPTRGIGGKLFLAGDGWISLNDWRSFVAAQ
jgi:type VI secretion system protein ImpE